ncbi:MAG: succinyl-diaminopimelate desuccinylase [Paracoccus sp. (in: a-proteobacteria)]|uniref:succinyl-diaminopimelate desuccinylase n=1 Tax=Paracoccus sp. TaxID=267 RepID=UPI0026DEF268|nr:succinyl-diaminopimelate desuccinylase [Paracoccus sp. (in: a-proteobacteria)]MDO5622246.1 succinyl-diaminopimelate desuccinylase [Paracoccus sp. (in: a-proteobacteria)]
MTDAADLTARLIRCPSVTPEEGGALVLLQQMLQGAGFECHRVDRNGTPNLFARWGAKGAARTFGFNGHTDVVPPGDPASWTHPPFSGHEENGMIWGRGATDMKSGVAAFVAAAVDFVQATPPDGAVILTITGDEEGPGRDGTRALLDWMAANGEQMTVCLVGEPSNPEVMGEMMKIGRRGSVTFTFDAKGVQGHAAYPHKVKNPVHALIRLLDGLTATPLDQGTEHFQPSGVQVTSFDVGNPASNVVPERARAVVNIRFNDLHSGASLTADMQARAAAVTVETGVAISLGADVSGEAFLTAPGPFVDLIRDVVAQETGRVPELSTSGGTSDARFVKDHCPVVEFGLVGQFMHQVDERVPAAQVRQLQAIYGKILQRYFHD